MVLRRIFRPRRDKITGEKRKIEELNDLYSSPIITLVTKSRIMRKVRDVAHMGGEEGYIQGFSGET